MSRAVGLCAWIVACAASTPAYAQAAPADPTPMSAAALLPSGTGTPATTVSPAGTATLTYSVASLANTPAKWTLDIDAEGRGHYHSLLNPEAQAEAGATMPSPFDQQIEVSATVRQQLFATAHAQRFFTKPCESSHKVAFTGLKTVAYTGPDGSGSCTFNWSQDAQLMRLAGTFSAISTTLEEGRRLRIAYLHDRLSLDAELETLATEAKSGQAAELANIAPELEAIASDVNVMKRAQAKASALLVLARSDAGGSH